jgi:hypothetical protein
MPKERKVFFFEKKKQKTFGCWAPSYPQARSKINKSFLLLFFKKENLSSFP